MREEPTPRILIHEGGPYEVTAEPILTKRAPSETIYGELMGPLLYFNYLVQSDSKSNA